MRFMITVVRAKPYANSNIDKSLYILKFTDFNQNECWIIYTGKRRAPTKRVR
jgi:hypothetical protein